MINNENSTNLSADSLQAPQIQIVWDSSQGFRVPDSGITCCYWSASLSNRLRAFKAHSSLFKCCEKNCPNYMYWIQGKHCGSWVWVFLQIFVSLKLIFIVPFNFQSISIDFLIRRGGCQWQGTASGPKGHIGRSKKWQWQGRKVTQGPKCHIGVL